MNLNLKDLVRLDEKGRKIIAGNLKKTHKKTEGFAVQCQPKTPLPSTSTEGDKKDLIEL